jgi:hypothetical protein
VDNGEKRDGRGRRLMAANRRERIKYPTFAAWVWKAEKEPARRSAIDFAEVRLPLMAPSGEAVGDRLEVRLPDGTVVRGPRVGDIAALVRALKG